MTSKAKVEEFKDQGYNVQVTGLHVLVTEAMKNYAIERLGKLERFSDRIIDAVVTMDIQKIEHRVTIVLKVDHTKIKSGAASEDMYDAINQAVDKLQKQLKKYKSKLQDHQARSMASIDMNVNVVRPARDQEIDEINEEIEDENRRELMQRYSPHRIVAKELLSLKTLTYDEALMKMDLSQDAFLIFKSEDDHKLKVMYRRKDGNYGVIELETACGKSSLKNGG